MGLHAMSSQPLGFSQPVQASIQVRARISCPQEVADTLTIGEQGRLSSLFTTAWFRAQVAEVVTGYCVSQIFSSVVIGESFNTFNATTAFTLPILLSVWISSDLIKGCARWPAFKLNGHIMCEFQRSHHWAQRPCHTQQPQIDSLPPFSLSHPHSHLKSEKNWPND